MEFGPLTESHMKFIERLGLQRKATKLIKRAETKQT